jgi:hypothetical protein
MISGGKSMRKFILVLLMGLFIVLSLNACKNDNSGNVDTVAGIPEDEAAANMPKEEIASNESADNGAASNKNTNVGVVMNAYTDDDELSLTKGGKLVKYNDIVIYIGEATGHIFMQELNSQEITEISKDRPDNLYFDGKWIFYSLQGNKKGVYRLGLDGSVQKISDDYTLQIYIYKDKLYYIKQIGYDSINGTPQGELYRIEFDGQNKTKLLSNGVKNYFKIHNDWIYYTRLDNRSLNMAKLDGSSEILLANGRTYIQLVTDNNVYYTDYKDGESLHKLNLNNNKNDVIGPWSRVLKCDGKVYIQTRLYNDDMILDDNFSIVMVDEEKDELIKLLTLIDTRIDTFIAVKGEWVYLSNNNTAYRINSKDASCNKEIIFKGYALSVLGDYAYYFNIGDSISDTNVDRIKLQ